MRLLRVVLIGAAAFTARAQTPGHPHGGGVCSDDWGCSLGGVCTASACACDVWFTGPTCALLNLVPGEANDGLQMPTYHSWGGRTLGADAEGTYHGYFSFICDHALLVEYNNKSAMVHATAKRSQGPYTVVDLVEQPFSHNTYVIQDPLTKELLIFHLGNGTNPPSVWSPCFVLDDSDAAPKVAPELFAPAESLPGQGEVFVESSASVSGPWSRFNNNSGVYINWTGSWTHSVAGNPAPFIFENGTTLLYFTAVNCPDNWGAKAANCIGVAVADSWRGPYQALFTTPVTAPESEDPTVFRDPRGNFHMVRRALGVCVGGRGLD